MPANVLMKFPNLIGTVFVRNDVLPLSLFPRNYPYR